MTLRAVYRARVYESTFVLPYCVRVGLLGFILPCTTYTCTRTVRVLVFALNIKKYGDHKKHESLSLELAYQQKLS